MASETVKRQRNRKIRFRDSRNSEANRKLTLKKKAEELATLCDITVCLVCFGPDGKVETWPESKAEVEQVINNYRKNGSKNVRENLSLLGFLETKKADLKDELVMIERGNNKRRKLGETSNGDWFPNLEEKIYQFSEEELLDFCCNLGLKIQNLRAKIRMMQAMETQNQNQIQNQYASPNYNGNDRLNMAIQCGQPSETLGWFDDDQVLAMLPVVSEALPVGYHTNILNNYDENSLMNLPEPVDEAFSGECYVNAESVDNNYSNCISDHPLLAAYPLNNADSNSNSNDDNNNYSNCISDHPLLAAYPLNNADLNSNSNDDNNNNITTYDFDDSYLLLGLEEKPDWFWGTSQLCFLD